MKEKIDNWFAKPHLVIKILLVIATLNLVIFGYLFGFHPNNDTDSFILTIEFFRGEQADFHPNRYLSPFYPVVGATLLRFLSPANSMIVMNIAFYYGILLLTYGLFRRVFGSTKVGFVSALIIITAYPMLRYGLTQLQDIGAYCWFVATLYVAWRWFTEGYDRRWLLLGGAAVSFGLLTKESGAMAAIAFGLLILFSKQSWKEKALSIGLVAFLPLITILMNAFRGNEIGVNSLDWYKDNWKVYGPGNYNIFKWVGVNGSAFNLIWPFAALGAYWFVKKQTTLPPEAKYYFITALIPSLSYFTWPIFIGRTVFISAWLLAPLAAFAIICLIENKRTFIIGILSFLAVLLVPYVLQSTLRYAHVFQILEICKNNIWCSWNYFWSNRGGFSKTM
jgi:4-amino-4-deoxy-L-arabinose transferase-like glycosyltransferase